MNEQRDRSVNEDGLQPLNSPEHIKTTGHQNKSGIVKIACAAAFLFGLILFIAGLCLITSIEKTYGDEKVIDYTNCKDLAGDTCLEIVNIRKEKCTCHNVAFNLTKPINGQVYLYYELPDMKTSEHYTDSRDNNQLAGNLNKTPSASCGSFSMNEGKPIAPCGEIADSFLQDTYDVIKNKTYLAATSIGLIGITEEDKKLYRNPPGDLKTAFKDFAKPLSWTKNIWELDEENSENNGFQNQRFILWMKTDLKRKPALRFNHTGLYKDGIPAGAYSLKIDYTPSSYVNQRLVILSSKYSVINKGRRDLGIVLIVLGLILFIISAIIIIIKKIRNR